MLGNREVAGLLEELADLLELRGENAFRVRAYRNAARLVEGQVEPVGAHADPRATLGELPGIGADLADKIATLAAGGRVELLDELRATTPPGLRVLLGVAGLGPKRVKLLHDALGIATLDDLELAARDGRLETVKGVGPTLASRILAGVAAARGGARRVPWAEAEPQARALVEHLRGARGLVAIEIAGSFRRRRPTVGDLDVLVAVRGASDVAERFVSAPGVKTVRAHGPTRSAVELASGLQVDLRVVKPAAWGAALLYFTGSKAHNVKLRGLALARDLKLNEYGLWQGRKRLAGPREEEVYAALGLRWIPPEQREDQGEVEAAVIEGAAPAPSG